MPNEYPDHSQESQALPGSARLARVLGIDIRLHITVVVIFALIVVSLAPTFFLNGIQNGALQKTGSPASLPPFYFLCRYSSMKWPTPLWRAVAA